MQKRQITYADGSVVLVADRDDVFRSFVEATRDRTVMDISMVDVPDTGVTAPVVEQAEQVVFEEPAAAPAVAIGEGLFIPYEEVTRARNSRKLPTLDMPERTLVLKDSDLLEYVGPWQAADIKSNKKRLKRGRPLKMKFKFVGRVTLDGCVTLPVSRTKTASGFDGAKISFGAEPDRLLELYRYFERSDDLVVLRTPPPSDELTPDILDELDKLLDEPTITNVISLKPETLKIWVQRQNYTAFVNEDRSCEALIELAKQPRMVQTAEGWFVEFLSFETRAPFKGKAPEGLESYSFNCVVDDSVLSHSHPLIAQGDEDIGFKTLSDSKDKEMRRVKRISCGPLHAIKMFLEDKNLSRLKKIVYDDLFVIKDGVLKHTYLEEYNQVLNKIRPKRVRAG